MSEPEAPTKDGYVFEGWFTDKDCTKAYDFESVVTKHMILYARWTWANPFVDMDESDWFYDNVRYAYENGLFDGISETRFAPNVAISRAMLVTVLYRAAGEPAVDQEVPFVDLETGSYYVNAVIWAYQHGIVDGVSETRFDPDANLTREQLAAILQRYAAYLGEETSETGDLTQFTDAAQISDWAVENVSWAVGVGLLDGKGHGILDPQGDTTRAEAAAVLQRFLERGND